MLHIFRTLLEGRFWKNMVMNILAFENSYSGIFVRSVHWKTEAISSRCSVRKMFLKISQNSQENNCARVFSLIKLSTTLLKKRDWHKCFPLNFAKFLKIGFFYRTLLEAGSAKEFMKWSFSQHYRQKTW